MAKAVEQKDALDQIVGQIGLRGIARDGLFGPVGKLRCAIRDIRVQLEHCPHGEKQHKARGVERREGGSLEEVMSYTEMRDAEDSRRYKELYSIDNGDYSFADLVIDTEAHSPEEIAKIILDALVEKGMIAFS